MHKIGKAPEALIDDIFWFDVAFEKAQQSRQAATTKPIHNNIFSIALNLLIVQIY
jgi:hypothetical protein